MPFYRINAPILIGMTRGLLLLLLAATPSLADVATLSSYAKGIFAEKEGEQEEARTHFEATLAADPDSFTVAQRTAQHQELAAASKTLRTYANKHPTHLGSQLHYADFLRENAPDDAMAEKVALSTLTAAHERFPHTPAIYSRLISIHEENDNREASLALFRAELEADDHDPFRWVSLIQLTRTLLPADDPEYQSTLDDLHARARRDGIAQASIARRVSDYYRDQGKTQLAIDTLTDHIHEVPDSLTLRTRLGLLLLSSKQEVAGVNMLEKTIAIDPDQTYAHRALAKYYERQDEMDKALHHEAEALRATGGDPLAFIDLANRYLENEQPHPARLLLEKARFDHPEHPAIMARLAIATLRDGDTKGAAQLFRQAEALARDSKDPSMKEFLDASFQIEFSHSLRDAGDLPAAETRLREAIRGISDEEPLQAAQALRELARLWLDQNKNRGPASALLRRAEALDPDNAETAELLERSKKK